jgi:hypothetical protein
MNTSIRVSACAVATLLLAAPELRAQDASPDDRLRRLEERFDEMQRQHQAEIRRRDEEIAKLRARIDGNPVTSPTTPPDTKPDDLIGEIDRTGTPGESAAGIEQTRRAVANDAADRSNPLMLGGRNPVSFNPDIAVITDFVGTYSSNRQNEALNRFDVREVEVDLRAAVHPSADGVVVLAFERDVENPPFPESEGEFEGVNSAVGVEEAYLFLHDFGVPNLTAKLGRYHVRFGRQNVLHLHDLPTADVPLVNQAFLAPEALIDSGLSLSYVIPPRFVGNQYIEVIAEVLTGEGGGSESPTLRGDIDVDSPALNTHILWNRNIAPNWNLELGASWLRATASADNAQDVNLYGGDLTLIRTDPTGGFFNQLFQAEAIYGNTTGDDGSGQNAFGFYVLGQQQLNRELYAGIRFDYTQNPNDDDLEVWAVSPYVSYYWSEYLRFRVEYQHKDGDVPSEDNVFFQATWIFGAHPPHPYWAMR